MKKSTRRWTLAVMLLLSSAGTAGYGVVRARAVGAGLGVGGSDARAEEWRMARNERQLRKELEARAREEQAWARKEERVFLLLQLAASVLGVAAIATGVGAWRARRADGLLPPPRGVGEKG